MKVNSRSKEPERASDVAEEVLPTFLVIGGVRCGTTSLYVYLKQHPAVFMPAMKEPSYFSRRPGEGRREYDPRGVIGWDEYVNLFREADGESALGEASAIYLYRARRAAPRIQESLPDVRLVVLLRDPVERAHSQYRMAVREGAEDAGSFREGLRREDRRIARGAHPIFHYRHQSLYAEPIERYLEAFGPNRLQVHLFRDFVDDPRSVVREVFDHIGVDPGFSPDVSRTHNTTRQPRNSLIHALVNRDSPVKEILHRLLPADQWNDVRGRLNRSNLEDPPQVPSDLEASLMSEFRPDIERLETLLDRDLSSWLR